MRERIGRCERGLGLVEVIAGTLVATLAVLGLAYSFGIGRSLIDRYAVARLAMGRAQLLVDSLGTVAPAALIPGTYTRPFWVDGQQMGNEQWTIGTIDDPIDRLATDAPPDPQPADLKRIAVTVDWTLGTSHDQLSLSRVVLAR